MKKNILLIGGGRQLGFYLIKKFNIPKNNLYVFNRSSQKILLNYKLKSSNLLIGDRNNFDDLKKIPNIKWDLIIDTSCYKVESLKLIKNLKLKFNKYYFFSSIFVQTNKKIKLRSKITDFNRKKIIYSYIKNKENCEIYINKYFNEGIVVRPSPIISLNDHTNRLVEWIGHVYYKNFNSQYRNYEFSICTVNFIIKNIFTDDNLIKNFNLLGATFTYFEFYQIINSNIKKLILKLKIKENLLPNITTPPFIENSTTYYGLTENKNSFISRLII